MLKQTFASAPIYTYFDGILPSIIEADASDYAEGVIHSQTQKNGRVHPVALLSRKFSLAEINNNIYDKEVIAIVLAFQE